LARRRVPGEGGGCVFPNLVRCAAIKDLAATLKIGVHPKKENGGGGGGGGGELSWGKRDGPDTCWTDTGVVVGLHGGEGCEGLCIANLSYSLSSFLPSL